MLEIIGVRKSFGSEPALRGVDLVVAPGELFALLGPSGCGKTTLLRILGGFEAPDAGEVRFEGARLDVLPPHERPGHMVFQRYALFPHLTVGGNVAFALKMQRVAGAEIRRRVEEALALVELQGLEHRRIQTLSGGQQQRVAIARAIVSRPRYLLLDEPLAALDLKLRKRMQIELGQLQRRLGITFVFVTHDQEEALTLADRVAVMRDGAIEQVGTPRAVYEEPGTAFVAGFVGEANRLPARLVAPGAAEVPGLGVLPVTARGDALRIGDSVQVMVRPEHLALGGGEAPGFEATVERVLFKGAHLELLARPTARADLLLAAQTKVDTGGVEAGAVVRLAWPLAAARAYPTESTP